jgi:hypothetical protein
MPLEVQVVRRILSVKVPKDAFRDFQVLPGFDFTTHVLVDQSEVAKCNCSVLVVIVADLLSEDFQCVVVVFDS